MTLSISVAMTSFAPKRAFNEPGDAAPHAARDRAGQQRHDDRDDRRTGHEHAGDARREAAEHELSLGADVEQPGAKRERDPERGEEQRGRLDTSVSANSDVVPNAPSKSA